MPSLLRLRSLCWLILLLLLPLATAFLLLPSTHPTRRASHAAPLHAISDPIQHYQSLIQRLAGNKNKDSSKDKAMPSPPPPTDGKPRLLLASGKTDNASELTNLPYKQPTEPFPSFPSGGFRDDTRIQFLSDEMRSFFGEEVKTLLFIPYAAKDYEACVKLHESSGMSGYVVWETPPPTCTHPLISRPSVCL